MRRKELNNLGSSPDRDHTLPKNHIIRGRRKFEELFDSSSFLTSPNVTLRFTHSNIDSDTLVAFIAPKKTGNAVSRIKTKRLLREAYRLNKYLILDMPENKIKGLHFAFIAKRSGLSFTEVQQDVISLLNDLRDILSKKTIVN